MPDRARVDAFVAAVVSGDHVGAIRDFYTDDATMQENANVPRRGREALMAHEARALARLEKMHTYPPVAVLVDGDHVVAGADLHHDAGVGAEDENGKGGDILHKGDFTAQCKYAFDKIKRALEKNGATFGDIVKMVTYMTDVRYQPDFGKCRQETFGSTPMPAHTLLIISQLAWPGMLVEIDATAMVPVK